MEKNVVVLKEAKEVIILLDSEKRLMGIKGTYIDMGTPEEQEMILKKVGDPQFPTSDHVLDFQKRQ